MLYAHFKLYFIRASSISRFTFAKLNFVSLSVGVEYLFALLLLRMLTANY